MPVALRPSVTRSPAAAVNEYRSGVGLGGVMRVLWPVPTKAFARFLHALSLRESPVVLDLARFAVDEPLGLADLAPERLDDRLVAEADAEGGNLRPQALDELEADTRSFRPSRPRRDHEVARSTALGLRDVDLVVADDLDLGTELLEEMREVVGEAVVVVDHQQHGGFFAVARSLRSRTIRVTR